MIRCKKWSASGISLGSYSLSDMNYIDNGLCCKIHVSEFADDAKLGSKATREIDILI